MGTTTKTTQAATDRAVEPRLVVADWAVDPHAVVAACCAQPDAPVRIVVPAWLHGVEWAGDPRASVPCAQAQLRRLTGVARDAGLEVVGAEVGDPDPMSAIADALAAAPASAVLLFAGGRHVNARHPLSLLNRAARLAGVPVRGFRVPAAARVDSAHERGEGRGARHRRGHRRFRRAACGDPLGSSLAERDLVALRARS